MPSARRVVMRRFLAAVRLLVAVTFIVTGCLGDLRYAVGARGSCRGLARNRAEAERYRGKNEEHPLEHGGHLAAALSKVKA